MRSEAGWMKELKLNVLSVGVRSPTKDQATYLNPQHRKKQRTFRMDLGPQIFPEYCRRPFVAERFGPSQQNCEPLQCDVAVLLALDVSQRLWLAQQLSRW